MSTGAPDVGTHIPPQFVRDVPRGIRMRKSANVAHLIAAEIDGNRDPHAKALCGYPIDWGAAVEDDDPVCRWCARSANA